MEKPLTSALVIIRNSLYKKSKYIFCCITVIISTVFISCKGKKTAGATLPAIKGDNASPFDNTRFGFMYVNACLERKKGNLQEAAQLFEECKKINPSDPAVHYELGTVYKLLGSNDMALANAKFCAQVDYRNEWYQLLLVDCYNATKQYHQAIKIREMLVKNFPAKNEFKEDLAIEYAFMGQYDKSFKIYDELERTYGINEQISLNKVKLLKSQKKFKEVEQELKKLSDSDKNEPRYYAYLAEFYLEQNDMEKAKLMYDKILLVDPNNPTVNLALHDYYSSKGKEQEAFEHLKKAFLNPDLDVATKAEIIGTFYNKAETTSKQAHDQGLDLAKIMLEVHPTSTEANAIYADFLRLDKRLKESESYYYKAAISEKRDFRVWENLLIVDEELGWYDSLEHHSARAIELFPSQAEIYLYNGAANSQLKNYSKAAQSLRDGLEFVSDNKNLKIKFLSALGDAHFNLREYEKSDKAFEEALKIDSDNTYVLNNYAYYLSLRAENLERAEKLARRANELRTNERSYIDTYGWILYKQKKYKEAEEWLSKAAKMGPKNPTILEHYGDVLYRLNKLQEAYKQWEAAKQSGGSSMELLNKIKDKKLND
jgi:tetratricopeptide (TPR) repeat protein